MEETPLWVETMGPLLMAVGAVVELPCELGQSLTLDHVAPISKSACSCRCLTGLAQVENCRLILEPGLNQRVRETRHRCGRLRDLGVRIMQPFARAPHLHLPVVHPPSIPKFAHPTPAHAGLRGSSQLSSWRPPGAHRGTRRFRRAGGCLRQGALREGDPRGWEVPAVRPRLMNTPRPAPAVFPRPVPRRPRNKRRLPARPQLAHGQHDNPDGVRTCVRSGRP